MKITGGKLKGHTLFTPPSKETSIRPLRSRIRKALFDILGNDLKGFYVLDLFAGTGALGIEALSRDADFVVFVDFSPLSIKLIHKNLEKLGLKEKAKVFKLHLPEELPKLPSLMGKTFKKFDLIFVTPPYGLGLAEKTLQGIPTFFIKENTLFIVEERTSLKLNFPSERFSLLKIKAYGETTLYFLKYLGIT
ncbi:MAG: 16S rRNA (guanine(966)-N(2))-methyltransferase RsmD [Caldimicrobium sp.]